MARISHTSQESKSSNPTTKYLEWKSNDKCFSYYDKAAEENVKVELPTKFVFLQHYHTVKGWHDGSQSQIGVYAISPAEDVMTAFLDVPGPGLLLDVMPMVAPADPTAVFDVRLINTGPTADTFGLMTDLPGGWVTWPENPITLNAYEERVVALAVVPEWGSQPVLEFMVAGQSLSNSAVHTEHPAIMEHVAGGVTWHLPMIVR